MSLEVFRIVHASITALRQRLTMNGRKRYKDKEMILKKKCRTRRVKIVVKKLNTGTQFPSK
jgi:hypothetical protein